MSILRRSPVTLFILTAMLALASGCHSVGSGTLGYVTNVQVDPIIHLPAQPAAISGSAVTVEVFRHDPGDTWPPPGQLGLWLHADSIPVFQAPLPADDPWLRTVTLVRLLGPSEKVTGAMPEFRNCDEIKGTGEIWTFGHEFGRFGLSPDPAKAGTFAPDRTLSALVTIDDTAENWQASWVLATEGTGLLHTSYAIRCGTITLTP